MNGFVKGENVFIPMDKIIGGQTRCGFGWNMLMDCLAEGRSVSLPASAVGGAKLALNAVGAYSRIRKQFRVPIAEMGGVQEALGRIASEAYILTSAQMLINSMLANHEQPAVLSAVMKYETTHRARQVSLTMPPEPDTTCPKRYPKHLIPKVVNDAMDVVGGAGICRGPANFVGNSYMSLPIAITVGASRILHFNTSTPRKCLHGSSHRYHCRGSQHPHSEYDHLRTGVEQSASESYQDR